MDLKLMICVAVVGFASVDARKRPQCLLDCPYGFLPGFDCVCRLFPISLCDFKECPADTGCEVQNNVAVCVGGIWFLDVCEQPKKVGPCAGALPRYFYNSATGKCERFIYGGCQGNENNFDTYGQCSLRCERKDLVVDPVSPIGPIQPITDVCEQPKKVGPCKAYIPRYFYNSATGRCERFIYGGCQGNENNFDTYGQCSLRCERKDLVVDPVFPIGPIQPITDVCEQPKKVGPCKAYIPRYYYNSATGRCERFIYGGCQGNENNFDTYGQCSLRCERKDLVVDPVPPIGPIQPITDVCEQPKKVGPCKAYDPQYFYNSATGRCERFIYGGCQGNENNFDTYGQCSLRCERKDLVVDPVPPIGPIRPIIDVCDQPKKVGPCFAYLERYFYNSATGRCEKFIYGGCLGNENNFDTYGQCSLRCERKRRRSYY